MGVKRWIIQRKSDGKYWSYSQRWVTEIGKAAPQGYRIDLRTFTNDPCRYIRVIVSIAVAA